MEKHVKEKWPFPELSSSQEGCPVMQSNSVRVANLWLEIWSQELAVKKQECYPHDRNVQ